MTTRANTGEQLREVAAALQQDQRNYLHEVMQGQARIAELEAELAALKSAPVVMPERRIQALAGVSLFDLGHAKGWNACIDEVAHLNRSKT